MVKMLKWCTRSFLLTIFHISGVFGIATTNTILNEKLSAIDSLVSHARNELNIPGMAVGIVANGQTIFARGYGLRDYTDPQSHVTNCTLFAIGSCTKAFTTYALERLINKDGLLNWGDLVARRIPEFRMSNTLTTHHIKVKDLVTHVSGLPRHDMVAMFANMSKDELLVRLPYLDTTYDLREKYQYNNIMYSVAGLVMERATNRSWDDIVRDRIFKPLNMTRSFTSIEDAQQKQVDNVATPHSISVFSSDAQLATAVPWTQLTGIAPAASIVSSVEDMLNGLNYSYDCPESRRKCTFRRQRYLAIRRLRHSLTVWDGC